MKTPFAFITALLVAALLSLQAASAPPSRPNVLLILADDMGFSDLGCYGSEIATPHLDKLASDGLRFTQFYNTAKCHSSRISLLTGRYPFQAGNRSLRRSVTIAELLSGAGYFTAMTGKWHLDEQPTDFGFQRYFGHLSGATSYFKGDDTFRLNGEKWPVPEDEFYTTTANVDFALKFLAEARAEKKPWCLYLAFNAPHAPLQPLARDFEKYLGRYEAGWDAVREERVKKQHQLGLFGRKIEACPRPDHVPAWEKLSPAQRAQESRRMAAYAALIDRLDQEIGRLIENLRDAGELDNTFILFTSDNGANPFEKRGVSYEGSPATGRWELGTGWAWMSNSPFRFYKQTQFEGGIAAPTIVSWPAGLKAAAASVTDVPAHLIDVLPTVAEACAATVPSSWPGRNVAPLAGVSLLPILHGESLPARPLYFLYDEDRALREGDWKLVSFRSNPWELFNLAADRCELHNLASQQTALRDRLAALWFQMAREVDACPQKHRTPLLNESAPVTHPEWSAYDSAGAKKKKKRKLPAPATAVEKE